MNLISEPWMPVRRANGWQGRVEPWRITDFAQGESPILAVASPRPDFDGALTQFLIGLLQTTCTPKTSDAWWEWRETPPAPGVLKERFAVVSSAFALTSDKEPLFMQERLSKKAEKHPIGYLLIGSPTDSTLKQNTDHFQKRPAEEQTLCPSCAAAALYTLQTFAPSGGGGGDGKFTSLRGGGPLTTLVLGGNLWETTWLNVLSGGEFKSRGLDHKTFPWLNMSAFLSDARPVKTIHSIDMNSEHAFWGMPRRIQLWFSDAKSSDGHCWHCALCGVEVEHGCTGFSDLTGGLTYQEGDGNKKRPSWIHPRHPLSPYNRGDDQRPSAVHPQEGGVGYRHWLGLIENAVTGKVERLPAAVVERFRGLREDGRLWAFGFDMDNMKARCWYDATMPLLSVPVGQDSIFKALVERLIVAADWAAGALRGRVKDVLLGKNEARGDLSFVGAHFWSVTESAFYDHAKRLRDGLALAQAEVPVLEGWRSVLRRSALDVFDGYALTGDFDAVDPRAVAMARNDLGKALAGKKLRDILGLPQSVRNTP